MLAPSMVMGMLRAMTRSREDRYLEAEGEICCCDGQVDEFELQTVGGQRGLSMQGADDDDAYWEDNTSLFAAEREEVEECM